MCDMANERQKRLMQEALDESIPQEVRQRLMDQLDRDPDGAAAYQRLRQVDRLLRNAPFEHAPKTLAISIMARLAEGLKQQQENLSHISGLALALALALVTVVMLPILVGISWLFLTAIGSAAALASLMESLASITALVAAGVDSLVKGAQNLLATYPQTPALMVTLFPVGVYWLMRSGLMNRPTDTNAASSTQ
jgi:hypothetical protein